MEHPVEFDSVLAGFDKYDVIFVATTSDYFLITYDRIRLVMEEKKKGYSDFRHFRSKSCGRKYYCTSRNQIIIQRSSS